MEIEKLKQLLKKREKKNIEFKGVFPKQAHKVAKEMVAFANTEGGTIFIGVDDYGNIIGVNDPVKTDERLTGIARGCDPPIRLEIERIQIDSKTIVSAKVPHKPLSTYNGTVYIRDGTDSRPAKSNEIIEIVFSEKSIRLEPTSKKVLHKKKLKNKVLKGLTIGIIGLIIYIIFFKLIIHISILNIALPVIKIFLLIILFLVYMYFLFPYIDKLNIYTIIFVCKHNLENEAIFIGKGRFIEDRNQNYFLVYKLKAKCIYPYCKGEIIAVDAPHKEIKKTGKKYVGICSLAGKDHSYFIDHIGVATKKNIDWSPQDKR